MLNLIVLMGRLTADPELKQTQNFKSFVRFKLAVNRYTKDKNHHEADFFAIIAWEKTAEFICNHFRKGDAIIIEGNVRTGNYTDNEGVKRKSFDVWARQVNFSGSKKKETKGSNEANEAKETKEPNKVKEIVAGDSDDDELPF